MRKLAILAAALLSLSVFAQQQTAVKPPVAKKVPKSATFHGDTRIDDYAWLRDKKNPDVIAYLQAENAYADEMTASLQPLRLGAPAEITLIQLTRA